MWSAGDSVLILNGLDMNFDSSGRSDSEEDLSSDVAEDPLVSVVIPTYNRQNLVRDAIRSVVEQTYDRWELVVVDDGSTDDTEDVVRSYADPRIAYVENTGPQGPAAARNKGVEVTSGSYLAFLDSDDIWRPGKLRVQVDFMETNPRVGIVGGGCIFVDQQREPTGYESPAPDEVTYEDLCISTSIPGSTSNVLVRREAFDAAGGFDPQLLRGEDRDLWIRVSREWEIRCVKEVTAEIRVHPENRRHGDLQTVLECRKIINRRIPEPGLRRKSTAWMWYNLGRRLLKGDLLEGARWKGMEYLCRSFLTYPLPLGKGNKRVRPFLWWLRDVVERKEW